MPYYDLSQTFEDARFYGAPDGFFVNERSSTGVQSRQYMASRMRGYITAPVTGEYRFWISGKTAVSLLLSDVSGSKYHKRVVVSILPSDGGRHGVEDRGGNVWDVYASQLSEPIWLEEGEVYYMEALQQHGHGRFQHLSVAWAYPGQERELIAPEFLSTYYVTGDDLDDDFLPDAWELANGLDPMDNGAVDRQLQGERGDFDGDGLTNREEFLLGTRADVGDSDGDGLSDFDEVRFYGTSPVVSQDLTVESVEVVDLANHRASANWEFLDGGLIADNFRGEIAWDFTVPSDGWWVIDLRARLRGDLRDEEGVPLLFSINGAALAPQEMRFRYGEASSVKVLTAFLKAGTHEVRVMINNYIGRRTLQLLGLQVIRTGGLDANENGIADWLEDEAAMGNRLGAHASTSFVSPAFIEGTTRVANQVAVAAGGDAVVVESALGPQHWYADVPLAADGETPVEVSFEQGQFVQNTSIRWAAWDAESGEAPLLRLGDRLKVVLPSGGRFQVREGGQTMTYDLAAGEEMVRAFDMKGWVRLTVRPVTGVNRTLNVLIKDFELETKTPFFTDRISEVWFPEVGDLPLDSGAGLEILSQRLGSRGNRVARLLAGVLGDRALIDGGL